MFKAVVANLDESTCADSKALAAWFFRTHDRQVRAKPSFHVLTSALPADVQAMVDKVRYSPSVIARLSAGFSSFEPLPEIDEIYLTHVQKDGGDNGLSYPHYDGIQRSWRSNVSVVRALICVSGDPDHVTTFETSNMTAKAQTCSMMALDYDHELHFVNPIEGARSTVPRVLIKAHYVACRGACNPYNKALYVWVTCLVNRVSRHLMRYSNDPSNPLEYVIGAITIMLRLVSNRSPLTAFVLALLILCGVALAIVVGVRLIIRAIPK